MDAGLATTEEILVTVTVSFDKAISGLEIDDFEINNGSAANLTEVTSGTEFTVDIKAASTGMVVVTLPVGSVVDESGNENIEASTSWEFTGTIPGPIATLDAGVTDTYDKSITVEVSFDKEIAGLSIDDFEVINGSATNLTEVTAGTEYTIEVTAVDAGKVELLLPAGSVEDVTGNENEMAYTSWQYIVVNAIESPHSLSYKLFPNPADNLLRIELENKADIKLMNTSGKVVLQTHDVLIKSFDVSHLSPGIYILQISSDKQTIRDKVLIN